MVSTRVTSGLSGFKSVMKQFADEGLLVDVFLRTYPMGIDVPTEVEEATKGVRIIQVTEDCLILGPKRPFMTTVIPIDEVASVILSSITERPDEDEIDRRIEEECPTWERDFARQVQDGLGARARTTNQNAVLEIGDSDLESVVRGSRYVVLDIYARWCQPCREVAAILEELHGTFGNRVVFGRLDGDEHEQTAEELKVTAYPTVLLFEDGTEKGRIEGAHSIAYFTRQIEALLGQKRDQSKNPAANGKVNVLSSEKLIETIESSSATVVMFYERGDYECQLQSRAMNAVAAEFKKKVLFAKVDVDAEEELAEFFEVEDIPEVCFIRDGEIAWYCDERLTKCELREEIERLLGQTP